MIKFLFKLGFAFSSNPIKNGYIYNSSANKFLFFPEETNDAETMDGYFSDFPVSLFNMDKAPNSSYYTVKLNGTRSGEVLDLDRQRKRIAGLAYKSSENSNQLVEFKVENTRTAELKIIIEGLCLTAGIVQPYFDACQDLDSQKWNIYDEKDLKNELSELNEGQI